MSRKTFTHLLAAAALVASAGLLAGCNEEAERPLHFEKGTYQGPQDTPLSAERLDALKQRVNQGRF